MSDTATLKNIHDQYLEYASEYETPIPYTAWLEKSLCHLLAQRDTSAASRAELQQDCIAERKRGNAALEALKPFAESVNDGNILLTDSDEFLYIEGRSGYPAITHNGDFLTVAHLRAAAAVYAQYAKPEDA